MALWTAGPQALANLLQVAQVARQYEQRSTSFREVVEALEEEAEAGRAAEAPIVEEGTEGVRMMTVHAAKGLEFPVVILAEPSATQVGQEPRMWVDPDRRLWAHRLADCAPVELQEHAAEVRERDREEAVRLTYVAATRARDLLVVPVLSEKRLDDTWTSVLGPSLWPAPGTLDEPRPAPGCPGFGADVVLDREGPRPPEVPRPGLHRAESGKNRVVWWDPATLDLRRPERAGLESSDVLVDEPGPAAEGRAAWEAWRSERARALEQGAVQAVRVRLAREVEEVPAGQVVEDAAVPGRRAGRPGGKRFGELVHAALAHVPLDGTPEVVARVVGVHARALFALEPERAAAVEAVTAALAHPLLEAARRAPQLRREEPVAHPVAPGEVVEGTVDLAFGGPSGWTVVDFKTDLQPAHREAYAAQVAAYARAVAAATGAPARAVLLWV